MLGNALLAAALLVAVATAGFAVGTWNANHHLTWAGRWERYTHDWPVLWWAHDPGECICCAWEKPFRGTVLRPRRPTDWPPKRHPACVATMCGMNECSGGSHPCYVDARPHPHTEDP